MFDCVVYICGHGETKDETARCLCNLSHSRFRFDVRFSYSDALVGRSRSIACTKFLQGANAPFMIFVDSDQTFTNENMEDLLLSLQAGYHVIAGGYAMADGKKFAVRGWDAQMNMDGKPYEVQYISTGFMGISRKALIDIVEKLNLPLLHKGEWCELWPFFECGAVPEEGIYISEDWDFCNKARKADYKCYFHTGILVGHLKTVNLPPQGAIQQVQANGQGNTQPLTVECLVKSLVIPDLVEYLGLSNEQLAEELKVSPEDKMVKEFSEWKGSSDEFYKSPQRNYLFELAKFNFHDDYWQGKIGPLGEFQGQSVVDIGCGIGTTSLFLAMNRNKVVGYDISPSLLDFAEYRRNKFGFANASFTSDFPEKALKKADCVIALDVLEHIEDLRSFLIRLGKCMKPEVKFYHVDSFKDKRAMHFDHSDNLHKWLNEAGFLKLSPQWAVKT